MINLLLTISVFMTCLGCTKVEPEQSKDEPSKDKMTGTWIEKNPELFDGLADTIVFTEDLLVRKHFYFNGWKYSTSTDTISFQKGVIIKNFKYYTENENEMIIYNFLDRSLTSQVKNIQFTKIK